jgi:hypothetical protein
MTIEKRTFKNASLVTVIKEEKEVKVQFPKPSEYYEAYQDYAQAGLAWLLDRFPSMTEDNAEAIMKKYCDNNKIEYEDKLGNKVKGIDLNLFKVGRSVGAWYTYGKPVANAWYALALGFSTANKRQLEGLNKAIAAIVTPKPKATPKLLKAVK